MAVTYFGDMKKTPAYDLTFESSVGYNSKCV